MNSSLPQTLNTELDSGVHSENAEGSRPRVCARGKFLFAGQEKVFIRGVTYGPFRPEADGSDYHPAAVQRDFGQMQRHGINAVRTYTPPPQWLLDLAVQFQLHLLVGLPWEQHIAFLQDPRRAKDILRRVSAGVRHCASHPAVLGYAIGNEIPAPLVRWYGHRRVEQFLQRLFWAAKTEDPEALITYVNYPSTEYLELPFLDFCSFNVYIESAPRLRAYLARLQNLSGDRPLVMGEIGLDSCRHGESKQAEVLQQQGRAVFEAGCSGLFYFSWTDEWHRGGQDIEDWNFGLTTSARRPKPALEKVGQVFQQLPVAPNQHWPFFSVVVCTYNGSRTLTACLEAIQRLKYPSFEVIVVDDGSVDRTPLLAGQFDVRLIRIPNGGLSNARNVGWEVAKGELVAYLDDDAAPDEHWLLYLALAFQDSYFAGVGGPNIAWPNSGWLADCVEHAPGNPTHVLLTDFEAEHLPGCNMAFRKDCLAAVGGFDKQFRIAGDDVDLCWRLQERGWKLGFHSAATVWHRRRNSLRGYWKQQLNYGKAEAMLERKWPEKYNVVGHTTWSGRLYGKGLFSWLNWSQRRIYHGTWGSALFQSVYSTAPGSFASILMLPEWYLVIAVLAVLSIFGFIYPALRYAWALLALAFVPPVTHAVLCGTRAFYRLAPYSAFAHLRLIAGTTFLHFLQPAARLWGRLCFGLTPWRRRGSAPLIFPRPQAVDLWSELHWQSAERRLSTFEAVLRDMGASVSRGGDFDRWDLQVRAGLLGAARLLLVIEEHGQGRQYVRMRLWPVAQALPLVVASLFAVLASVAALDLRWAAWALLNIPAIVLLGRTLYECAAAMGAIRHASRYTRPPHELPEPPAGLNTSTAASESTAPEATVS